jgi:hypothetical protein
VRAGKELVLPVDTRAGRVLARVGTPLARLLGRPVEPRALDRVPGRPVVTWAGTVLRQAMRARAGTVPEQVMGAPVRMGLSP